MHLVLVHISFSVLRNIFFIILQFTHNFVHLS
jgi:hypothetical protein